MRCKYGGQSVSYWCFNPRLRADYNARYDLVFDLSVRTNDKEYRTIPELHWKWDVVLHWCYVDFCAGYCSSIILLSLTSQISTATRLSIQHHLIDLIPQSKSAAGKWQRPSTYFNIPSLYPTLARGLFTREIPKNSQEEGKASKTYQIVARGYDKFFNIEVPWVGQW